MRVISNAKLRAFWQGRTDDSRMAEHDLSAWRKLAEKPDWTNFGELKQTFGSADQVGNCVVFDVGNNRYRLIGRVNYRRGIVYVLKVMDHREYDKKVWIHDCGCKTPPPPPRQDPPVRPSPVRRRKGRKNDGDRNLG